MRLLRKLVLGMAAALAILLVVLPLLLMLAYRFVPPPGTPLMLIRLAQGEGLEKDWVPLSSISSNLQRAVIASEDSRFCTHRGFDWGAIEHAVAQWREGGRVLGASTISMQTSKNLFLWPDRTMLRKGVEAWLTVLLETVLPKQRILEIYLNIAEWGPGIYGAEAAARTHFGKSAQNLTTREAALLAAVLPAPRSWSPSRPSNHVSRRAATIQARLAHVRLGADGPCPG
ncbi:monofunctional biosynthetic peptidoglycan transglycosylase [Telmatospirillum sp. J64-1]|uniref:monofunctional biosynthetic peptidoglycan transglycosylase n=1 Tax=Telmatospirillum sp. J64-1 TaxID=2502183 RepID=UPI0021030EC7|nr:monofunctional biosynthetic peptidoglycan transglycosylase [Telmatospirillum sp. J64-1]